MTKPLLSVVVPCYNETEVIHALHERVSRACGAFEGWDYELLLVDDGSRDDTRAKIFALHHEDPHVVGVFLSRNHGHQLALSAGLDQARGERVFILDADLQDPPELIHDMMARMDDGAEVVYGQREKRDGETAFKLLTAKVFYRLINALSDTEIPMDTGDFRLMSRKALDMLRSMPERQRFIRGMVSWIGLRQDALPYHRDARFAGETKYPLRKMIAFAADAITSFSVRPLKLASLAGVACAAVGLAFTAHAVWARLAGETTPGWASIVAAILICSSLQLLVLGLIGEYLGRMYMEAKGRPMYLIDRVVGGRDAEAVGGAREQIQKLESDLADFRVAS